MFDPDEFEEDPYPRDHMVDAAKERLRQLFLGRQEDVFFHRQLTVLVEKEFFHWITGKALKELVDEQALSTGTVKAAGLSGQMHFFFHPRNRYWKRKARAIAKLVEKYSVSDFGRALGHQGELLVDGGVARAGMLFAGENVKEWKGKRWVQTEHDLDRVFTKGGVDFGVEIKNTLDYIPKKEMEIKLAMCSALGLRPIFVVRAAPKSYIEQTRRAGGFTWMMGFQFYPFGQEVLAKEVKTTLGLPVDCPRVLMSGTVTRLQKWVDLVISKVNSQGAPGNSP